METREYKVFKFEELTEAQQNKVLERYYDINVDHDDWSECVIENFKEDMAKQGYSDINVFYSGFSSQGDGACFESRIDLRAWMKAHKCISKARAAYRMAEDMDYSLYTKHSGHYYHSGCMRLEAEAFGYPDKAYTEFHEILVPMIEEDAREQADTLYRTLENEYDYLTSKEAIIETVKANEYSFTEDGEID